MNNSSDIRPSDKYIPLYFVAFFLVVFVLDGIFVYLAINTHTGTVTEKAYEKGLSYGAVLEASEAQKASGVTLDADFRHPMLSLRLLDGQGRPKDGAIVRAFMIRPVPKGHDYTVTLTPMGEGVYSADIRAPLPGAWTAKIEATWDNQTYRTTYRLVTE